MSVTANEIHKRVPFSVQGASACFSKARSILSVIPGNLCTYAASQAMRNRTIIQHEIPLIILFQFGVAEGGAVSTWALLPGNTSS